ncbi:MAG: TIGR01777 family protein [Bacteroidia bacterium]|nr:TIGR01777 family protein [Bacteroidia bacterium]
MKYLITGGTGFIGTYYTDHLLKQRGNEVIILSRGAKLSNRKGLTFEQWDGKTIPQSIGPVDVVLNLAGAGIADKRWTDAWKKVVKDSRERAAKACVEFINGQMEKPKVFLAGSAIGYYGGDPGEEPLDETGPAGEDFMAEVCKLWEDSSQGADTRTVILRTGVVMGRDGGPLKEIMKPYSMFVGGPIGDGKQGFPWIHMEDWALATDFVVENEFISGPVNLVAPTFTNAQTFSDALASVMHRPNLFHVPRFALEILLGEASIVAWGGYNLIPDVLKKAGYQFKFPEIKGALKDLLG